MRITYEEKYKFLLKYLKITDIDAHECDALISMRKIYFQHDFIKNGQVLVDEAIELAIQDGPTRTFSF